MVFGIVQGSTFEDLRRSSAQALAAMDFDGYAIGGVSVGEPEAEMMQAVEWSEPHLPENKPRYAMGLGTPPQMIELIARGMDMFDCVLPTRLARNGTAFTAGGTLNLKNAEFAMQKEPIEEGCICPACRDFTRGYIRHLIKAEEILGLRLITIHNLHFYLDLMSRARRAIEDGSFADFRARFVAGYKTRDGFPPIRGLTLPLEAAEFQVSHTSRQLRIQIVLNLPGPGLRGLTIIVDPIAAGLADDVMRHFPRVHDLETIASCRPANQRVHFPLRLSQARRIRRRDPDDFLHGASTGLPDKLVEVPAHLFVGQRPIHPIGAELNDEDCRFVPVDQLRQLRRRG